MEFVEKHAGKPIKLNQKSHLPLRLVKANEANNYNDPRYQDI